MQNSPWQSIATAPERRDIQVSVIDADGVHALVFPCRLEDRMWVEARTGRTIDIRPTHWRAWTDLAPL